MKKGSADDPFAEDPQDGEEEEAGEGEAEEELPAETSDATISGSMSSDTMSAVGNQKQSLPYIYARDSVKDGRQQRPIFLRDEIEDGIPELVSGLEETFDENVYRTDVLEAAVLVAQENPGLIREVLSEWGYGWD